jgi:NAD(P)-dependent dehydrogenase (short-subunit alcohol dehydrogenase family)
MRDERVLDGKAVVVTGAGGGLGRAFAIHAAACGAAVVVNDIDLASSQAVSAEITSSGGRAMAQGGSVADWEQADALVRSCSERFGRLDGLVNNAGVWSTAPSWEEDEATIRRLVEINLLGVMFCGRHAFREMVAQERGGSIVNVSSPAVAGLKNAASYAASKGGVLGATYAWAVDAESHKIRVNALLPSARTPMAISASNEDHRREPEWDPSGVAPLVTYLLGDLSSDINGQAFRFARRRLSVWGHPGPATKNAERTAWTPREVGEAIRGELAGGLQPLGLESSDPAIGFLRTSRQ